MSIQISMDITGHKELQRAFGELPKSMTKQVIVSALKKVSKPIVKEARDKAPKRTGKGAKSIKARTNKNLKPIGISIGPDRKNFHMMFVEFGTINQAAEPYLRPALDNNKGRIPKEFGKVVWPVLLKKVKTLRRKAEKGTLGKRTAAKFRTR